MMNSKPKQKDATPKRTGVDWRNTQYQFHAAAVPKYGFRPFEIAIFNALFSALNKENVTDGFGTIQMSNVTLMERAGLTNRESFRKARDRLIEAGVIRILKKGIAREQNTTYQVKLLGSPKLRG